MRQFSIRSVVVGLFVGTLMCFTNMYFGLQTGWITMGSLQSAILGFGIFKALKRFGLAKGFSIAENVIVQTTSVATATMPVAAGFVGIIPALSKLTVDENPPNGPYNFSQLELIAWSMTLAFFGVFVAIPLRTQVIEREHLKFPSGTATAQVIKTLHAVPMDEAEDPDPRRVVPRLGACPNRLPNKPEAPLGFRFHSSQSALDWQYSRKTSDILLSTALDGHHDITIQGSPPTTSSLIAATALAGMEEDEQADEKGSLAGVDVSSLDKTWIALGVSFLVSFLITVFAAVLEMVNKVRTYQLPTKIPLFGTAAAAYGWKLGANGGYVGQGMIMGPRVCFSMLLGSVVGFGILAPVSVNEGWAKLEDGTDGYAAFVTWVAMSIMIADSLTSLAVLLVRYAHAILARRRKRSYASLDSTQLPVAASFEGDTEFVAAPGQNRPGLEQSPEAEASEICEKFPNWIWISGIVMSVIAATGVFGYYFPMPHWQVVVAMVLAMLVAVLAVRALGETDLNPVSGIGKLTQVCFALLAPGKKYMNDALRPGSPVPASMVIQTFRFQVLPNLVAGAISEAAAMQAGDMMQDFKTAYLLGICPKSQFHAALIGSLASCGISTAAYALFSHVYVIGGEKLPAPTAAIWLDMARLVTGHDLPAHVVGYCWAGAVVGVALALLPELLTAIESKPHLRPAVQAAVAAAKFMGPSGIGFAVGMYISPEFVLPRVLGGILCLPSVWAWVAPSGHHGNMLITASGLVLGEGIASMLATIVRSFILS